MANLNDMREKRATLVAEARKENDEITDKMSGEEAKEYHVRFDAAMAAADTMEAAIKREERVQSAEAALEETVERKSGREDQDGGVGDDGGQPKVTQRSAFDTYFRYGSESLSPEESAKLANLRTSPNGEIRAQSVGTTTAGGFLVPEGYSGEIDRALAAWGPMWDAGIVRELNTSTGNDLPWPTINDTAKSGRIKVENASVDDDATDDVVIASVTFKSYVYDTGMVRIPIELMTDSLFPMEALLDDLFAERLGRAANTALTTGTGSSQPKGIVTASSAGKTAASATAIAADELLDLLHSVDPAYRQSPKARWMFNDNTLLAIKKLKDGQGNYLWQMGDVRTNEPNMLLGHPYSINQAMDSIATAKKTVLFGDMGRYIVRKVNGFAVINLKERYAENLQVGMFGYKRFDGNLVNTAAVKHMLQA